MRRAAALAMFLLAGCLAATGEGTFRFVEVTTDLRTEGEGNPGICGFPAAPVVDEAARTVTFPGDWPGRDQAVLFLFVSWDRTGCGTATAAWATSHRWGGTLEGGGRTFEMLPEGGLRVGDHEMAAGDKLSWSEEGAFDDGRAWTATVTVRDHGEWPRAGLRQAE